MNFGIAYGIVLLIAFVVVWIGPSQYTKILFLFSDILVALPAFFIKISPFIYWDNIKFANLLNIIRSYNEGGIGNGLTWALHYSLYSSQPLVAFYIWLFSLFQQNGFFFFTTTFLFLFSISLMMLKIIKYFKLNKNIAIIVQTIILMIFNLFYEIEGVRNFLAFGIFSTALFIDLNTREKRWKIPCFLFYIIAYMFHPAVLPFVAFRLILLFKNRFIFFVLSILSLTYTPFLNIILSVFQRISFLAQFDDKAQVYLYGQSNYNSFASTGEILITSIVLLSLILELILLKNIKSSEYLSSDFYKFYIVAMLFTLGSFFSTQVYLRSIMLILFLSAPIKSILFSSLGESTSKYNGIVLLYRMFTILLAIVMFMWWYKWTYTSVFL